MNVKLKKRPMKQAKSPEIYNILENYTDFDPPGNVMVCAMAGPEDVSRHASVLSESYGIPLDEMKTLLHEGGIYTYPPSGGILTKGLFVCKVDPEAQQPKLTWIMDVEQCAEAEKVVQYRGISLLEAVEEVFHRGLADELQERLKKKNLGIDYTKLDRSVAKGGDITYIDFRKDWSPHFKRKCVMPDGSMVETGGVQEFADLHRISVSQAQELLEKGGTLEIGQEVLACQIVNNQPTVAHFNEKQYAKAKELTESKNLHILDALSEVAFNDPILMRSLRRLEQSP